MEKLTKIRLHYQDKPVEFFEDILQVELDEQQKEFLRDYKPGCRLMIKSAKGTGKSFLLAGLVFHLLLCFPDVYIRTVAPSYDQMISTFMREVNHHHMRMSDDFRDLYDVKHDRVCLSEQKTYKMECISSNTSKKERLGGMHSKTQVFLFDEASGISDETYYMCLSSMGTADYTFVLGASNPERAAAAEGDHFYTDLFMNGVKGWNIYTFTAHRSSQVKPESIQEMIDLYGEDSDEYRVAVLGEFPRSDGTMYIPMSLVDAASDRIHSPKSYQNHPIIVGADIARSHSGDKTVFTVRQHNKLLDIIAFQVEDTMISVGKLQDVMARYSASICFMDADGVGGPVADRCRETGLNVVDVRGSFESTQPALYGNVRTQCWGHMRDWLQTADIWDHQQLKLELGTQQWGYTGKRQEILRSKKLVRDSRGRKIPSPDFADSLSFTFFQQTINVNMRTKTKALPMRHRQFEL